MRHKNSISQVNKERDAEVRRLVNRATELAGKPATIERVCQIAVNLPVSKFYISDYWAVRYVKDRLQGKRRTFNNKHKSVLYNALFGVVNRMLQNPRYAHLSVERVVYMALETPAPTIGLSESFIRHVIRYRLGIFQYDSKLSKKKGVPYG